MLQLQIFVTDFLIQALAGAVDVESNQTLQINRAVAPSVPTTITNTTSQTQALTGARVPKENGNIRPLQINY